MNQRSGNSSIRSSLIILATFFALPASAVEIDGHIDVEEWSTARHITDFRKVQPLNGEPAPWATEAWVLSTPEGLAIAMRCTQPPSMSRTHERVQRDFESQVDRVNIMIDFDGDARTGYMFRMSSTGGIFDGIISNENNFNKDWDGNWRHAASEDEQGWSVELLIPWHIAPMRAAQGDQRTIKMYFDRVVGATGERVAWPFASFTRPRFMSDFAPVELANYSQSLLAITPYVSGLYDNLRDRSQGAAGVDVFWKPNGQTQLTATLNPDFGQVESDDLVVSFDATETFVSDKRPFFTENQGLFEFTTPSDDSQLLYTRRVGAPTDDGRGSGDITGALKLNGNLGATKYGIFAADESDEVGRTFGALRVVRDLTTQNLGLMLTTVNRPYLDREATVLGLDHNWRPSARWNIQTRVMGSDIEQGGQTTRGDGATVWADYEMNHGWRQQWIAMHFSDDLQLNDAGYLSRNDTNYLHWQFSRRFTDLAATSRYTSKDWRWRVTAFSNDHGQTVDNQFRMSRESNLRNGSYEYAQININAAAVDDLLTRGHGYVNMPPNFNSYFNYSRPRKGNWSYEVELRAASIGLAGNDKIGYNAYIAPTYFVSDNLQLSLGAYWGRTPDWLVWTQENLIGSFDAREAHVDAGLTWTIGERQELRVKLQAIALDAEAVQPYRVDNAGHANPSGDPLGDFAVRNLGFQIRYRYELAPLSYVYVVYGRGGYRQSEESEGAGRLLGDSFSLRDDEQLLVKWSYRFEK
jgi:Domain of unknown function (DUF5916)